MAGCKPDEVVIASDRIERYYDVAEELIRRGEHTFVSASRNHSKL